MYNVKEDKKNPKGWDSFILKTAHTTNLLKKTQLSAYSMLLGILYVKKQM